MSQEAQQESRTTDIPRTSSLAQTNNPPEKTKISAVPVVDLSADVRQSMKRQFDLIQTLEEEEDAFSERLGEAYMGYGSLLAQAGQLDEARDMYAKALHLSKINFGIYSLEQRAILRAMFELFDVQGSVEEMENVLNHIVWLEKKHQGFKDIYSYDLVMRLGNAFREVYYSKPKFNEISLARVNKAIRYLSYASNHYNELPLADRELPYGQLALLYFISAQISREVGERTYDYSRPREFMELERKRPVVPSRNILNQAALHLHKHLDIAEQEENFEHQALALRDLGDLYSLFNQMDQAEAYYRDAWWKAENLDADHPIVSSFEFPVAIPNFHSTPDLGSHIADQPIIKVPISLGVNRLGRVVKIHTRAKESETPKLVTRARRKVKSLVFRPAIENGKPIATERFQFNVSLKDRSPKETAKLER